MKFARKIFYKLPPSLRFLIRRVIYLPIDLIFPKKTESGIRLPARGKIYTGGGDFLKTGKRFVGYFTEYASLKPESHVLDIGSGIGRMAIPLTDVLSEEGKYEGFDAIEKGVLWCQKNVQARFAHFNFSYIPLANDLYRNAGINPSTFIFPYKDNSFDLCILISVFTHMLPDEIDNYLIQIFRVLKPGASCFASFFVMDEHSAQAMKTSSFQFPYDMGDHYLFDKQVTAANVAYPKDQLEITFAKYNLSIKHFFRGHWSGLESDKSLDFQDIYVLTKKENGNEKQS
jgi:SAM-dependent methyltransferase